ncbi:Zn-ribbon domain-containing OB-fold protein [Frankia gtarii]|uniref:Zn-ribbon domain-containing OB-fold protein n=1 Tax=Frankia gtarii TaxID=2950102 RepID=UPI0021BF0583|nr:OB-fold domain-containing protein [Frankia gtarii]
MSDVEILDQNLRPYQAFLDGLAAGSLLYQRCGKCAAAVFYPRVACNVCGSVDLAFQRSAGQGTVYSNTAVASTGGPAYSVCIVELDEGFRMMSSVVDVPAEEVPIGLRVVCRFETSDGADTRLVFAPRAAT